MDFAEGMRLVDLHLDLTSKGKANLDLTSKGEGDWWTCTSI